MTLPDSAIRLVAAGALLCASFAAPAAGQGKASGAEARYQSDRAACSSISTQQDRATCLREAGAALQEARRGGLTESSQYEQNRLARCDLQPASDRGDCIRRMNGEGVVTGSVEGGGVYRELRTTVPSQ